MTVAGRNKDFKQNPALNEDYEHTESDFLSEMLFCSALMQGRQREQRMKARIMVNSLQLCDDLMTCWQSAWSCT